MIKKSFLIVPALLLAGFVSAKDLTHPTEMNLPASNFERPNPTDYQLSLGNGLTAYIAKSDHVPLVTLSAFIKVGKVSDDKQGSAEVLRSALTKGGTATMSRKAFKDTLRLMTAKYSVTMHDEWTEISLNVPKEDLAAALPLFAGLLLTPSISEADLDIAAKHASEPPEAEVSLATAVSHFNDVLYAGHPYSQRPSKADIEKLTVGDVKEFHQKYFVPSNMTLAIVGDINDAEIRATVTDLFGDMPNTEAPTPRQMPAIKLGKAAQHTFSAEKLQSWFVIGHELPVVPLEDKAAVDVLNYILAGGHQHSRMSIGTRYKYGYTNDASGFLVDHWYGPGSYTFRSYSRPEVIKPLFDNMLSLISNIGSSDITDEELFIAKGALRDGTFPIRYLDGYATVRDFAIERLRYGNHDRSASYIDRVGAVSAQDVIKAANKYIRPGSLQTVLVGYPANLSE